MAFDKATPAIPLVNVVCVGGIVDPETYLTARVKKPGNRLVLYGASTGRDGLGGASFASRDLSEDAEAEDRPCVQVGDPYTEKLLIDATLEMAATGRSLHAVTSAPRDLREHHRRCPPVTEPVLRLTVCTCGERHERGGDHAGRVAGTDAHGGCRDDIPTLAAIMEKYSLQWRDIGEVIEEARYIVTFEGNVVCDLPIDLLVEGGAPGEAWHAEPYSHERPYQAPEGISRHSVFLSSPILMWSAKTGYPASMTTMCSCARSLLQAGGPGISGWVTVPFPSPADVPPRARLS
ncbi:AIR synthase-related protein [Methanogenium cariaci]|uniref:AIR synthase-related protein n=1 Tax=Methanogenium cariaci TaxID=2197 RepID=UPI001FE02A47|nr:AIR synthase-related protein [Methanogenium cariaci]